MPMLVQILLEFANALRVTHVQNSYHYLKVCILWIGHCNSLILREDARLTTSLRGSIEFLECIVQEVEIMDLTTLNDSNQQLLVFVGFRVSGESTNHVTDDLKFTLVNVEVMARYSLAEEKLRKN